MTALPNWAILAGIVAIVVALAAASAALMAGWSALSRQSPIEGGRWAPRVMMLLRLLNKTAKAMFVIAPLALLIYRGVWPAIWVTAAAYVLSTIVVRGLKMLLGATVLAAQAQVQRDSAVDP